MLLGLKDKKRDHFLLPGLNQTLFSPPHHALKALSFLYTHIPSQLKALNIITCEVSDRGGGETDIEGQRQRHRDRKTEIEETGRH